MEKLLADTNILRDIKSLKAPRRLCRQRVFGIAVDRNDKRRKSVWEMLDRIAKGEIELYTAKLVVDEIKQNPHKPTMEKELSLVENMITSVHDLNRKAEDLAKKLENYTSLDVIDSQIVAIAISNGLTFWSGDYYILREKTINEINKVLKECPVYSFKYRKE